MIQKIKTPIRGGRRVIEVDGKEAVLAGPGVWFGIQPKERSDYLERVINYYHSLGHNFIRFFVWEVTKIFDYTIGPAYGTQDLYRRVELAARLCCEKNMVPMIILSMHGNLSEGTGRLNYSEFTDQDKKHFKKMVEAVKDYPLIWDVQNEAPDFVFPWMKKAIKYLKEIDSFNRPIHINTGFGGSVTNNDLHKFCRDNGITCYSALDGDMCPKDLVTFFDTDHSKKVLQSTNPDEIIDWYKTGHAYGADGFISMEAWGKEGQLHPTRNSSNPNNPKLPRVREWLGKMATPLSDSQPTPQPTPDPDPEPEPTPMPNNDNIDYKWFWNEVKDIFYNRDKYPELDTPAKRNLAIKAARDEAKNR